MVPLLLLPTALGQSAAVAPLLLLVVAPVAAWRAGQPRAMERQAQAVMLQYAKGPEQVLVVARLMQQVLLWWWYLGRGTDQLPGRAQRQLRLEVAQQSLGVRPWW